MGRALGSAARTEGEMPLRGCWDRPPRVAPLECASARWERCSPWTVVRAAQTVRVCGLGCSEESWELPQCVDVREKGREEGYQSRALTSPSLMGGGGKSSESLQKKRVSLR